MQDRELELVSRESSDSGWAGYRLWRPTESQSRADMNCHFRVTCILCLDLCVSCLYCRSITLSRAFLPTHPLVLLSRSQATLEKTAASLPSSTNQVELIPTDATSRQAVSDAFASVPSKFGPGSYVEVAVFNAGGGSKAGFNPGPFLERSSEDLQGSLTSITAAYDFGQAFLQQLPEGAGGTLIFTGATMSLRGSAKFAHMAPAKAALRSLASSIAKEYHPKGVHVAHVIVDGLIDTENVAKFAGKDTEGGKRISPDAIGKAYKFLHEQDPTCWTHELDLRPMKENWTT